MKKTEITIVEADPRLLRYKHSQGFSSAERLKSQVEEMEARGLTVLNATARRSTVPNCYYGSHRQHAPAWVFDGEAREIRLTDMKLQSRPHSAAVPARFVLQGEVETPEGCRCLGRGEGRTEVIVL